MQLLRLAQTTTSAMLMEVNPTIVWAVVVVVAIVVLLLIFIATRPDAFRVERSTVIAAPPSAVFAEVNDFHRWKAWSPWAKIDPAMTETYSGPAAGVGASYDWLGNKKVGQGKMTILESKPGELVRIDLQFFKPFSARHVAEFKFEPAGGQTRVTWAMTGRSNFILKAMQLFCSMDKMVGKDFEKGLAAMKGVAEGAPQ